jgi:hypothetical protein
MPTVIVVANETLASRSLVDLVRDRAQKGDEPRLVLVAPMAKPSSGLVAYDDVLRDAAQHRIDTAIAALAKDGVTAEGEVFDPDPFNATMDAVREFRPDEIIVSTHPESRSGWLRRDLIDRVREAAGLPVEHVVVDLDAEREHDTHTLVVANQTAAGKPLLGLLKGKAAESEHRFVVVMPQAGGGHDTAARARERLDVVIDELKNEGVEATGVIGDPDPYQAVMNALSFFRVDEIVISTHPAARSGWLRADLIERVRRSTSKPVEHVVVDLEAGQAETTSRA